MVVENGEARGAYNQKHHPVDLIVQSPDGAGSARDCALNALLWGGPNCYVVHMDDDDTYSPGYIQHHLDHAEKGVVNGSTSCFTEFDDDLLYCDSGIPCGQELQRSVMGATMGYWLWDVGDRRTVRFGQSVCGEERNFVREARKSGLKVKNLSGHHVCVSRKGLASEHTWQASREKYLRLFGGKTVRVAGSPLEVLGSIPYGPLA